MKKLLNRIKLLIYLFRISKDPEDTKAALAIGPCLLALGHVKNTKDRVSLAANDAEFIRSRYMMKKIDLQQLQNCAEGTLGRVFSDHMLSNNLDPEFYGNIEISSDESYVVMRLRQTHDLWHVLTGFATTFADELGLQAFMYAQTGAPLSPLLIGGAIFKTSFTNNPKMYSVFDRIVDGWQLGRSARPIFSLDWENNWNTPLSQLRETYSIGPNGVTG